MLCGNLNVVKSRVHSWYVEPNNIDPYQYHT